MGVSLSLSIFRSRPRNVEVSQQVCFLFYFMERLFSSQQSSNLYVLSFFVAEQLNLMAVWQGMRRHAHRGLVENRFMLIEDIRWNR